jgi:hypothetical protein
MLTVFKFCNYGCVLVLILFLLILLLRSLFVAYGAYLVVCCFCRTIRAVSALF